MAKLSFIAGFGAGYVLGARAGTQRYEQIKKQTSKVWGHPQVQEKVGGVTDQVRAKAPQVAAAAGSAAVKAAGQAVRPGHGSSREHRDEDLPQTITRDDKGELHADTSGFGPGGDKLP